MFLNLPEIILIILLCDSYIELSHGLFMSSRINNILRNIDKSHPNQRKVDDIFSLLSEVEHPPINKIEIQNFYNAKHLSVGFTDDFLTSTQNSIFISTTGVPLTSSGALTPAEVFTGNLPVIQEKYLYENFAEDIPNFGQKQMDTKVNNNNNNVLNEIPKNEKKIENTSTLNKYLNALSRLINFNLPSSKSIQDVIETVNKVSKIYDREKEKLRRKSKFFKNFGQVKEQISPEGVFKSATKAISHLLDSSSIEAILKTIQKAKEEDEILEEITSVMLKVEGRGGGGYGHGSGLTLDPVTCIALVTLAAYLIRAIFQILTLTTGKKRSIGGADFLDGFLYDSNLPLIMSNVFQNRADDFAYDSLKLRNFEEENKWLKEGVMKLPGEAVLAFKLIMDERKPCLQEFVCVHLGGGKRLSDFGLSHLLWSSVSLYDEFNFKKVISEILSKDEESCRKKHVSSCPETIPTEKCPGCPKDKVTKEERCPKCPKQAFNQYIQLQTLAHKLFEEFINRNDYFLNF